MSDTDTPVQETTEAPNDGQEPVAEKPKTFDEGYVKTLRQEAAKYRTEAQQAKERVSEFEEANQTELEKLTSKNTSLTDEARVTKAENIRLRVAIDKKIPADLIDRLRGDTQEELDADAEKLLSLVNKSGDENPDFDGGAREPAPDPKTAEEQHNDVVSQLLGMPST